MKNTTAYKGNSQSDYWQHFYSPSDIPLYAIVLPSTNSIYLYAGYADVVGDEIAVVIAAGVRVAAAGNDGSTHRQNSWELYARCSTAVKWQRQLNVLSGCSLSYSGMYWR